jgi:ABC-type multidrug transport system fused ATPase/permease subunit
MIWITWALIAACCASILWLIKVYLLDNSQSSEWFFLVYTIPLLISSMVFLMLLYNLKRAFAEGKTEIEEGKLLARWRYSEEEWKKFNAEEWEKSRKRSIFIPFGILALFFLIGWLDAEFSEGEFSVALPFIVLFLASLSAALFFYSYALYKRTFSCPREVVIGPGGFFYGGFYNTWEAFGTRLAGVTLIPGDIPIMEFDIKVIGKSGSNSQPLRIPVPRGREREAESIIAILTK